MDQIVFKKKYLFYPNVIQENLVIDKKKRLSLQSMKNAIVKRIITPMSVKIVRLELSIEI